MLSNYINIRITVLNFFTSHSPGYYYYKNTAGARRFISSSSSSNISTKRNKKPLVIKGSSTFMFYFYIIIFPIIFVFILALFKALLLDTVFWSSISPFVHSKILIYISILIVIWWFFFNLIKYMLHRFFYINKQFILYKFKPLYLYKKIKLIYDDCHDDENEKELLELINMFRISGIRALLLLIYLIILCIFF